MQFVCLIVRTRDRSPGFRCHFSRTTHDDHRCSTRTADCCWCSSCNSSRCPMSTWNRCSVQSTWTDHCRSCCSNHCQGNPVINARFACPTDSRSISNAIDAASAMMLPMTAMTMIAMWPGVRSSANYCLYFVQSEFGWLYDLPSNGCNGLMICN